MTGGTDENFVLDGVVDLFVYGASPVWSAPDSFYGDIIFNYEDVIVVWNSPRSIIRLA